MQKSLFDEQCIANIIKQYPLYKNRFNDLFYDGAKKEISSKYMKRNIIINPKSISNLVESTELLEFQQTNFEEYVKLKSMVYKAINFLLEQFKLNALFIYQNSCIIKLNHNKYTFFQYAIQQLYKYHAEKELSRQIKKVCMKIAQNCAIKKPILQKVTRHLTDLYFSKQLNSQIIEQSYEIFAQALHEHQPFLYFLDKANQGIKVLLNNTKWPFNKGMTVWTWFQEYCQGNAKILQLKTQQNNIIVISLKNGQIVATSKIKEQVAQSKTICTIPSGLINLVIELSSDNSLFSTTYFLKIKVNETKYDVNIKVPRFTSSQFITQFTLFSNFIGCCYSIVIGARSQIDYLFLYEKGLSREQHVNHSHLKEQILCVLNADRSYKGLLINYLEKNQGCYAGDISNQKTIKILSKILLPYLYFLCLVEEPSKQIFSKIIIKYIQLALSQRSNREILYVLYFLQISKYNINKNIITTLLQFNKASNNFYLNIVSQYLDIPFLFSEGFIVNDPNIQINPVEKLQLLFYLQSSWKKIFEAMMGFQSWWSPTSFNYQNNKQFNSQQYKYQPKQINYQWSVKNFVTNDYVRCILQPLFKLPEYNNFKNYGSQYVKKQLMTQSFNIVLEEQLKPQTIIFEKVNKSRLYRLKQKFKPQKQQVVKQEKQIQIKYYVCDCVWIDLLSLVIGELKFFKTFIIFTMKHNSKLYDHMGIKPFKNEEFIRFSIPIKQINFVRRRRYNQSISGLQVRLKRGSNFLFYCLQNLENCINVLEKYVEVRKNPYDYYLNSTVSFDWIDKKISNFYYLMWLNDASGRHYNDITQYPVLPWTLVSNEQKLFDNPKAYRELTKNMGSMGSQQRKQYFIEKYTNNNQNQIFNQYHFGTHYSSSAIIFNYMIRLQPFSLGALTLQSGKYDCADRIFASYPGSWNNAITSPTDIRQLIPEVYTIPQMFININNYNFGQTQVKQRIDNVQLPNWAHNNPYLFVIRLRQYLQNQIISANINHWIDLIFGYKQRGSEAVKSMNIFFPLTYQDSISVSSIKDLEEKMSIQTQIAHFGQNPSQIIGNNPHPLRRVNLWQEKLLTDTRINHQIKHFDLKLSQSEHNQLFGSVFQAKNSILCIKFINNSWFVVLQKHQYNIFRFIEKKGQFISQQHQIQYQLEYQNIKLDYRNLQHFVPMAIIQQKIIFVGGFYSGYLQILFIQQSKYNKVLKLPLNTITTIEYCDDYHYIYLGDAQGKLTIYETKFENKFIFFTKVTSIYAHSSKINHINKCIQGNMLCTCSDDGTINIYNLYSLELLRVLSFESRITFATISSSPLYSIAFYSPENLKIYSYSINGQYLSEMEQKTGFIYNFTIFKSTNTTDCLVYVNSHKQLMILQLPLLKQRRKIKIRKDTPKVSCVGCGMNSRIAVAGSEDGHIHFIADKYWFD